MPQMCLLRSKEVPLLYLHCKSEIPGCVDSFRLPYTFWGGAVYV